MELKIKSEVGTIIKNVLSMSKEYKNLDDECRNSIRLDTTVHEDMVNVFLQETEKTIAKENPYKRFKKQQRISNKSVRDFNEFHNTMKITYFNDKESLQSAIQATETTMIKKGDLLMRAGHRVRTNDDVYGEEIIKNLFAIVQYDLNEKKFSNIRYNIQIPDGDIDEVIEEITYNESMTKLLIHFMESIESLMIDISNSGVLGMKLDTQDGINEYESTKIGIIRKYGNI